MKKTGLNRILKSEYKGKSVKGMIETRWNTVFDMIDSILPQYNEIASLLLQKNKFHLIQHIQREGLKDISDLLEFFKSKTNLLEGETDFNYHLVWQAMEEIRKHIRISDIDSELTKSMKSEAIEYIEKDIRRNILEPNMLQKLAVFLHPIMKSLRKLNEIQRKEVHNYANSFLLTENSTENTNQILSAVPQRITSRSSSFYDVDDEIHEADRFENIDNNYNIELSKYIDMKITSSENFDLKSWWIGNKSTFPNLFNLFLRVQSITATSAASERSFSKCRHILNDQRSRTDPEFVNDLMVLTDFVKQNKKKTN